MNPYQKIAIGIVAAGLSMTSQMHVQGQAIDEFARINQGMIAVSTENIDSIPVPEFPPLKEDEKRKSGLIPSTPGDKTFSGSVPPSWLNEKVSKEDLKTIELVDIREMSLKDALRFLSDTTGLNLVPSLESAPLSVSLYLKDVTAWAAVDALAKAHNLYATRDTENDIIRIHTETEYRRYQGQFVGANTQVFTLLYPNAIDIATAIENLFGNRVLLSLGADSEEVTDDLEERFRRFDLISGRGTVTNQGGQSSTTSSSSDFDNDNDRNNDSRNNRSQRTGTTQVEEDFKGHLPHQAPINVTVIKQHNQIAIRTQDEQSLKQISELIQRLDVPTPLVLLEVKIMSILLEDGFQSAFDFAFEGGKVSGGFGGSSIQTPSPIDLTPQGSGFIAGSMVYQYVGDNVRGRMQLLADDNRVTTLGAPILLTANNEVSELFVGEERPILVNFTAGGTQSDGNQTTTLSPTPQFETRLLGRRLLMAPNINADRTVSLRILQEVSGISDEQAQILIPDGDSLAVGNVDFVTQQSVSGTVVAKDGEEVIIGGLIQEQISTNESKIPVLGDMPGVGFLFRDETDSRRRQELVVMIKPYVLNTAAESNEISRKLMSELSLHPMADDPSGTLNLYDKDQVLRARPENERLKRYFRFHSLQYGK